LHFADGRRAALEVTELLQQYCDGRVAPRTNIAIRSLSYLVAHQQASEAVSFLPIGNAHKRGGSVSMVSAGSRCAVVDRSGAPHDGEKEVVRSSGIVSPG
jgi:hypothetical protein